MNIEEVREEVNEIRIEYVDFKHLTRANKFREDVIDRIDNLKPKLKQLKEEKAEQNKESEANHLLALECLIDAYRYELKTWNLLKEEKYDEAWSTFESSRKNALNVKAASPEVFEEYLVDKVVEGHKQMDNIIFPEQTFFSPGLEIGKSKCSICDGDYSQCSHIKKLPYNGEFCIRIIDEVKKVREISMVSNPANPLARAPVWFDSEGKKRHVMTGKFVKAENKGSEASSDT